MKLHRIAIQGLLAFSDRVDLNLDLIPAGVVDLRRRRETGLAKAR